VLDMDRASRQAERTIVVLSPDYFASRFTPAEWAAAFRRDPIGEQGILLPIRVRPCEVEGLLGQLGYIDLLDHSEQEARAMLLAHVQLQRHKPVHAPAFPSAPKPDRFPGMLPALWNVPHPRNCYFTGREDLLQQLAAGLRGGGQASALSQPQAMSGLGGIGKTQIALEYAYRYYQDYQAVLWVQAQTRETLISAYLAIARLLDLPEKSEQESARIIAAVKDWFQHHSSWLLILDNADELALAREFLPPSFGGHVLLTTRAQVTGRFARRFEVGVLPTELGAFFLLRRTGLLAPDAPLEQATEGDREQARAIREELGGLPLALDQAGAYIEETGCSLGEYQRLYQHRRADLLAERRGQLVDDHPLPVATTWSLSFQSVEEKNPASADLLRLCAFLAPDAIPEVIITRGAEHLGPTLALVGADPYQLNQAIEVARAYSLLRRESSGAEPLHSVHRLVQAVVVDQMEEPGRKQWAERAVQAVAAALPAVKHESWSSWERLLAHALQCAELIKQWSFGFAEATQLLQQTGWYLTERIRYPEAEQMLQQGLSLTEQEQGGEHLDTARDSLTLAYLYQAQGKYAQAEPLLERALAIREQQLGAEHPSTQTVRKNYAFLLQAARQDEDARTLEQLVNALPLPIREAIEQGDQSAFGHAFAALSSQEQQSMIFSIYWPSF
jgi:Tetratricopeptide repeat/TIR domain/NB-ARC domain